MARSKHAVLYSKLVKLNAFFFFTLGLYSFWHDIYYLKIHNIATKKKKKANEGDAKTNTQIFPRSSLG